MVSVDDKQVKIRRAGDDSPFAVRIYRRTALPVRFNGEHSLYPISRPVGKSCEQVGITTAGDAVGTDAEVFDKWAQALSSAHDLAQQGMTDGHDSGFAMTLIVPIVVVPNGRLWTVDFDLNGMQISKPEQAKRCSYYVDREYLLRTSSEGVRYTLSHLEFATFDGLASIVSEIGNDVDVRFSVSEIVKQAADDGFFIHVVDSKKKHEPEVEDDDVI
jgi:hypothetical protein